MADLQWVKEVKTLRAHFHHEPSTEALNAALKEGWKLIDIVHPMSVVDDEMGGVMTVTEDYYVLGR